MEPVFCIRPDPYSFQGVNLAYRNGFADPAFLNATMCAISFAQNGSVFTPEVLYYQGQSIRYINEQLGKMVCLELTIGAILLLVGIEVSSIRPSLDRTLTHPTVASRLQPSRTDPP